jgi:hypothetical protein
MFLRDQISLDSMTAKQQERMSRLCQSILEEQERDKFLALVHDLNHLLSEDERS